MGNYTSQDPFEGTIYSRIPTRERLMVWSRYEADTSMATEMSFPSTANLDAFTRADSALSAPWATGYYGNFTFAKLKVTTNALQSDGSGGAGGMYADAYLDLPYAEDQEAYATILAFNGASDQLEITARGKNFGSASTWGGYAVSLIPQSSSIVIFKYVNSIQTALWSAVQTIAANDSFGIRVIGPIIQAWYKTAAGSWTKVGQVWDYDITGPGKIGFYVESTTARLDVVGGGEIFDARPNRGIWFNSPTAVEVQTEWAHPYFDKVRSYSPVTFPTFREAQNAGGFTPNDYRPSSPQTYDAVGATTMMNVIDGPMAGYKGVYGGPEQGLPGFYIGTASSLPSSQITVAAWIKQPYLYNWPNYINHDWTSPGSWLLYSSNTYVLFGVCDGAGAQKNAGVLPSAVNFTDNNWHFVVGTYDGTTVKCYVDGLLGDGSNGFTATSAGISLDTVGGITMGVGSYYGFAAPFILPTALTESQVKELYDIACSIPVAGDQVDRYKILSVSGWDKTELRDARMDDVGDHGENPLPAMLGGRNITINGEIRASNLARLRYMIARLKEEAAGDMLADVAMDNVFWKQSAGTLTVYDPSMNEPTQIVGRVTDLKIEEQQKSAQAYREFQMTIRQGQPETGTGFVQVDSTVNLINGATLFSAPPGPMGGSYQVDSLIRIGNYPTGAATAAISGTLTITSSGPYAANDFIALTNPVWPPNEWWEIDSRDCSVKAFGLSASAYNRFSFVDMANSSSLFLRGLAATSFINRTGTVSAGTPKFALFKPDNGYL